ncbi:hypothetical protein ACFWY6_42040 [Streptomyces sp. NPDC059037]|uniref:hypothetical protein n=1 Tax=Streptomyces sp. NPDC059037 TaxID=3346710 RepID=UPI00368D1CA4
MLILLGAAGGVLRGVLDAYNCVLDWQAARREHRQAPAAGQEPRPPLFRDHFDPVADTAAAVIHSGMGAGAAVLFGTTGQISGAYAAFVVGVSAPVILTQLGRIQAVSDAVTGAPTAPAPAPAPEAAGAQQTEPLGPRVRPTVVPEPAQAQEPRAEPRPQARRIHGSSAGEEGTAL